MMEHKKQYPFRIRLACEVTETHMAALKQALEKYSLSAMSQPKETPIAEQHFGFPHLRNHKVCIIDVLVDYPANPVQIREMVRDSLKIPESEIMVMTPGEEVNAMPVARIDKGNALLNQDELSPADPTAHELVGDKRAFNLVKELSKTYKDSAKGVPYQGVNDQYYTKDIYSDKKPKTTSDLPQGDVSPVGTHKMKLPSPRRK
jgi:hypothetical protein